MRLPRGTKALVAAATLLLAGCGQSAAPAASSPAAAAAKSVSASPSTVPAASAAANPNPSAPGGAVGPNGKPLESIKVSFAAVAAIYAPLYIAIDKGYLAQQGLSMEIVKVGGGVATPGLMSGSLDYSTSAASSMSAIIKGAPLKVIFTNSDRSEQQIWAQPSIASVADLQGKTIGVATRGDSNELAVRMLFSQQHLNVDGVSWTPLGYGAAPVAALKSGSVPAAVISGANATELKKTGFNGHMLADLKDIRMLYTGLVTTDKELQQHGDRARRLLYATAQGREYFKAFKDQSIDLMTKYTGLSRDANVQDYDDTLAIMTDEGTMTPDAQQQDAQARARILGLPAANIPAVNKMYDYSLMTQAYNELRSSGWKPQP